MLQGAMVIHNGVALFEPNSIRVEGGHVAQHCMRRGRCRKNIQGAWFVLP